MVRRRSSREICCHSGQPPPAKLARSEETVEEALDLSVNDRAEENESPEGTENETAEETEDDDVEEIEAPEETG
ncbi:Zinc finger CCCH domain containing protein 6 [Dissostichus eleginoides]|uniref:Zinc finger CCCH domain containing protein 6 n=1 Tax=Dissostichus eleginoides TaxID=100907 RepID=A0AAD9B790_DISEL|nr:Zinc finger CCCH domain containing protein 6 [Dissostichus eleginoides]